ncbi:MAG: putative DNA modification/repair radical SAM protein, partial [Bacillota bacterium]
MREKLRILTEAAKYDVSCSSSGSRRKNSGGLGNSAVGGICHSWSDDGRCISLLKILFTNRCIYDCSYCVNRASNDIPRASFTPDEVVKLTVNFYRRNYIEGLFLSSAVEEGPDYTMERLLKTVSSLRDDYNFNGYIHLKAIPGADYTLIHRAGKYADRMSVNIELPSEASLNRLAPQKRKRDILDPMKRLGSGIQENREDRKKYKNTPSFVPAGQSTQLIVGASPESDYQILRLSEGLYQNFNLKRVYYSAFMPVTSDQKLPVVDKPPLLREHRLYQADWLLRFYKFEADELLSADNPNFDVDLDPKANWALNNIDKFPLEVNRAPYELLLRVPGIGPKSCRRIVTARQQGAVGFEDLKKFGTVLKRA